MNRQHKRPKTTNERRQSQDDEYQLVRGKRSPKRLPDAWDDLPCGGKVDEQVIKRWIQSKVGQKIDLIYSKFIAKFGLYGRDYWDIYVEKNVTLEYGKVLDSRGLEVNSFGRFTQYYEHEGLLKIAPKYPSKRKLPKNKKLR